MNELITAILSEATCDIIKKGISVSTNYIKKHLQKWIIDDETIEKIAHEINNVPDNYLQSKEQFHAYLENNNILQELLAIAKPDLNVTSSKNIDIVYGNKVIYGNNNIIENQIVYNENINNTTYQPERTTNNQDFLIFKDYSLLKHMEFLKSYNLIRDNLEFKIDGDNIQVGVEFDISDFPEHHNKESNFVMVLLNYLSYENWSNFVKEDYNMEFELRTSYNINKIMLEIKCSSQKIKIVNEIINTSPNWNLHKIKLTGSEKIWKEVSEICFTLPLGEEFIQGEKGLIEIKNLVLTK